MVNYWLPDHTPCFFKNNFIRTLRLKFGLEFFKKLRRTRDLSMETFLNDTKKGFLHLGRKKSLTKIKNIRASEKIDRLL